MSKKILLLFLVLFGCLAFGFVDAETYYYNDIEVDITINKDSTFNVVEKQTYYLNGSFGFFYRDIELKDLDHIKNIEVYDSNNNRVENPDIKYRGNDLHVQWNFARRVFDHEMKAWTIKYTVVGGLRFFDNHDELYWNAIFEDREVDVRRATVNVYLPEEVKSVEAWSYVGTLGSKESSSYKINGNAVKFNETLIAPQEFLTISVSWNKGLINKPFLYRNQIIALLTVLIALIIPIIVFFRAFKLWKKEGKDYRVNKTIIAQYEPPDNLSPAIIGVIKNQNITIKEIIATVIDLAVRGYLKIVEKEEKILFFKSKVYVFEKLKPEDDLRPYEQRIMKDLFSEGNSISTSDLKNKFYKKIKGIKEEIHKEIAKTNLFNGNIEEIRKRYGLHYFILLGVGIVFFFLLMILVNVLGLTPILLTSTIIIGVSFVASSIMGLLFAYRMPVLTKEGAEAKWKALGFKEYLHTAERFRIETETLETFSKFLPYAMIFGVEKQWAKRFEEFDYKQQGWYAPAAIYSGRGGVPANFGEFSSGFSSFSSALTSSFSPPGGSGTGGAGGAGGGGGGGGGGAG